VRLCRFVKYNDTLREFGPALAGCKGNTYVTTTHVVNSAIVKMSKLTMTQKVYRGVAGGLLPESFWRPNEQGVKGGIESAFMSTTFEREVAMAYAAGTGGKPALVFEMQMGMIDRGAKLGWISQYPHEEGARPNASEG
jgi:NLR family CARD domain-containing protein 3